jgi:hypothetical protein
MKAQDIIAETSGPSQPYQADDNDATAAFNLMGLDLQLMFRLDWQHN